MTRRATGSRNCSPSTASSAIGISGRCTTSASKFGAAKHSASSAKTAPARARCCKWWPASCSPPRGSISVNGRVSALLELGAGFNPEFTGRDNVYLNGSILGLSTRQIDQRYKDIEEFAEIGDFINQPVKTYSSGMVVRLAFAVAINVDPEILLVDEALAVGDIYFRQRCMRKVHELRARGITILFVSHAIADVKAIGDRALWLEKGRLREIGETDRVVAKYLAAMVEKDSEYLMLKRHRPNAPARPARARAGDGRAHPEHRPSLWRRARRRSWELPCWMPKAIRCICWSRRRASRCASACAPEDRSPQPIVGFMMRNQLGIDFSGTNTAREGYDLPAMLPDDVYTVDFHLDMPELYPSSFSFSPAIADGTLLGYQMCDWIDNAIALQMGHSPGEIYGFLRLPCRVEVNARAWRRSALSWRKPCWLNLPASG